MKVRSLKHHIMVSKIIHQCLNCMEIENDVGEIVLINKLVFFFFNCTVSLYNVRLSCHYFSLRNFYFLYLYLVLFLIVYLWNITAIFGYTSVPGSGVVIPYVVISFKLPYLRENNTLITYINCYI